MALVVQFQDTENLFMTLEFDTPTPPSQPAPHGISAHPFTASLALIGLLVLIGSSIVFRHGVANPPAPEIAAWGGGGDTLNPLEIVPGTVTVGQNDISHRVQDSPPYTYTMPDLKGSITPPPPPSAQNSDDSFNYEKFMAGLGQNSSWSGQQSGVTDITYAFPPASLFVVPTPTTERSPIQQSLYNYGNEVGSYIQSYEQQHPDQTRVLKDQLEDRDNPSKVEAVVRLGRDLSGIGTSLLGMEDVPSVVSTAHTKVAKSYQTMGQNLKLVPEARSNEALLSAIKTYNASADVFAKDFVALVSFFSTYGVTFGPEDAGSVFTFTYSGGM
jgi:hypothetical protein